MILDQLPNVQSLSASEKWQLAEELWNELIPNVDAERDDAIVKLIESRMEEYRKNPESATTWDALKNRLKLLRHA
jgi:putative addiction module component (TIGR02574 family)